MDFKNQTIISGVFIGRVSDTTTRWLLQSSDETCLTVTCSFIPVVLLIRYTFTCTEFNGAYFITRVIDSEAVEWSNKVFKMCFMDGGSFFTENEPFGLFLKKNRHIKSLNMEQQLWSNWEDVKRMCLLYGTTVMDSDFIFNHFMGLRKQIINHNLKWDVKPEFADAEKAAEAFWVNEIKYATIRFSKSVVSLNEMRRITYDELMKYKLPTESKEFKIEIKDGKKLFSLVYEKDDNNLTAQVPVEYLVNERIRFNPPTLLIEKTVEEYMKEFKGRLFPKENNIINDLTKNQGLVVIVSETSTMPGFVDKLPNLLFRNRKTDDLIVYSRELKGSRSFKTNAVTMELQLGDLLPDHECLNVCKPYDLKKIDHSVKISVLILVSNKGTPRRWIEYCKTKKAKKFIIIGEFGGYY
jgi:hypothetical protein